MPWHYCYCAAQSSGHEPAWLKIGNKFERIASTLHTFATSEQNMRVRAMVLRTNSVAGQCKMILVDVTLKDEPGEGMGRPKWAHSAPNYIQM